MARGRLEFLISLEWDQCVNTIMKQLRRALQCMERRVTFGQKVTDNLARTLDFLLYRERKPRSILSGY